MYVESLRSLARDPTVGKEIIEFARAAGCLLVSGDVGKIEDLKDHPHLGLLVDLFLGIYAWERLVVNKRLKEARKRLASERAARTRKGLPKECGRKTLLEGHPEPQALAQKVVELEEKRKAHEEMNKPGKKGPKYGWGAQGAGACDIGLLQAAPNSTPLRGLVIDSQNLLAA